MFKFNLFRKANRNKYIISIINDINTLLKQGTCRNKIIKKYKLTDNEWFRIASKIYRSNLATARTAERNSIMLEDINRKLMPQAFSFPRLGNNGELNEISLLLRQPRKNKIAIQKMLIRIIMDPNMRALYHLDCYSVKKIGKKNNPIFPFHSIIESSLLSFYRGNYIASYMTIIPVIEGILLRWQEFPSKIKTKPTFEDSIKFVKNSYLRQPAPGLIGFFDVWCNTAVTIMKEHLFKPSSKAKRKSNINFNRHLVAHLLYDTNFATVLNITRAFNLIDIIIEIFINENQCQYHWLNAQYGWVGSQKTDTYKVYNSCINRYFTNHSYEDFLRRNDHIVDLRNYI